MAKKQSANSEAAKKPARKKIPIKGAPDVTVPNVLAERYASRAMRHIWSAEGKILLERDFWIATLKGQQELGLNVPDEVIDAYERVKDKVDLASIAKREKKSKHDVKARIEEFCDLAGHQHIHKGMTSRDLTENVEQLQVYRAMQLILAKTVASIIALGQKAGESRSLVITGRTHNVPAQATTMGKRLAMFGEELLRAADQLSDFIDGYPARGLKGAVGTQADILALFNGDTQKVAQLESSIIRHLGLGGSFKITGQVYPRSLDMEVVSHLCLVGSAPANFARTLRLMAGHELADEGFLPGQTGSSAMPHKMNSRSCERINGFHTILKGYLAMASGLAGDQWNEGDVSCSVARRVFLPDSFFAIDGLLETFLTVIRQMNWHPAVIARENAAYSPFLTTTLILMEAVKQGAGRETAHECIKEHALATVRALRAGEIDTNNLYDRLAGDERLGLSREQIDAIAADSARRIGAAEYQVDIFLEAVEKWKLRMPEAEHYSPHPIL